MNFTQKIRAFFRHFDNNVMEYPKSLWRRAWNWTPLYWLRSHTFTRYGVVNVSGQDNYTWGWIDRCHLFELACWKILVDFVEKESPDIGKLDTAEQFWPDHEWFEGEREAVQAQVDWEKEIRALYTWWTQERKLAWEACGKLFDESMKGKDFEDLWKPSKTHPDCVEYDPDPNPKHDEWYKEHCRLEAKDEEMFMRLVKVHGHLWT